MIINQSYILLSHIAFLIKTSHLKIHFYLIVYTIDKLSLLSSNSHIEELLFLLKNIISHTKVYLRKKKSEIFISFAYDTNSTNFSKSTKIASYVKSIVYTWSHPYM